MLLFYGGDFYVCSFLGDDVIDAINVCTTPQVPDVNYEGNFEDPEALKLWISQVCLPLVREITFQNGEEMTEMGLPLLILFYHPDDISTKDLFKQRVELELREHRG